MSSLWAFVLVGAGLLAFPPTPKSRLRALNKPSAAPLRSERMTFARLLPRPVRITVRRARRWASYQWSTRCRPRSGPNADLALAADLLGACLEAGLPVPIAVRAVATTASEQSAAVLRSVADALALGAPAEEAWGHARHRPDTAELARAACRTASSGSALATESHRLAERLRQVASDRVEARAQRAGVLIAGPLGLCFLPAFVCLGVLPVIAGLAGELSVAV